MAQFRVYENTNRATKQQVSYLLDIQSDLLDDLQTTVVIPLYVKSAIGKVAMTRLCPLLEIENTVLLIEHNTDFIAATADRFLFLTDGKLSEFADFDQLRKSPAAADAYF